MLHSFDEAHLIPLSEKFGNPPIKIKHPYHRPLDSLGIHPTLPGFDDDKSTASGNIEVIEPISGIQRTDTAAADGAAQRSVEPEGSESKAGPEAEA